MTIASWEKANNILCIRLDYLGDVLMCTPAMRAIKDSRSDRCITLLSSAGGAATAPFIPEIDAVIEYAAPWMKNSSAHDAGLDLDLVQALNARRFDAAVIFTTYSQSALPAALLCYLAGIPLRLAHCRENPYQLLTDWIADTEPQAEVRHEVRRQLDLVSAVGCRSADERLSFKVPAPNAAWANRRLSTLGIDTQKPWVLIHPGATAASRRYPPSHWITVTRTLTSQLGYPIVFTGSADEEELIEGIRRAAEPSAFSLAGELDLGKLGAMIACAPVVVSNNTGPAHIAAALGRPLVVLYALTNPQHTPWQTRRRVLYHDVPCRFCYKSACPQGHHDCLNKVEPSQVVEAVQALLQADASDEDEVKKPLSFRARQEITAQPGL
ncbi:MAG: lipopolysaccharide heptosyltransferase II [Burkholderiales bacterium RIFCSPLOWO2_02_FULL_57_36]|nr:MAG: lipopolysaccharide heptosyltransferase II [Burkholderiales bacterium RIFCSPLOWO2_02_FULL_57_36]